MSKPCVFLALINSAWVRIKRTGRGIQQHKIDLQVWHMAKSRTQLRWGEDKVQLTRQIT